MSSKVSQERPKSEPYLRLKIAKRLQSVKVFSSTVPKSWTDLARQGGPFEIFHSFCRKSSKKLKGDPLVIYIFLKSHNAEKTQREDPLVSSSFVYYALKYLGQNVQFLQDLVYRAVFRVS